MMNVIRNTTEKIHPVEDGLTTRIKHYHQAETARCIKKRYSLYAYLPGLALLWLYSTLAALFIYSLNELPLYAAPLLLLPAFALGIYIACSYHWHYFVLGPTALNVVNGRRREFIAYYLIHRLGVNQTRMQRLLGYGTLSVSTMGPGGKTHSLHGLSMPRETAKAIEQYRIVSSRNMYAGYTSCSYCVNDFEVAGLW